MATQFCKLHLRGPLQFPPPDVVNTLAIRPCVYGVKSRHCCLRLPMQELLLDISAEGAMFL